jgi:gliding motility-associated lipoprotein GldH
MKKNCTVIFLLFTFCFLLFSSCTRLAVYEKDATIPKYEWQYNFVPSFSFTISDTAAEYNLYIVLRHTDAYEYNNICLNVGSQFPADTLSYQRFDLPLATDATGWEGTGMDDIWELRKSITHGPFRFNKQGIYKFTVAQAMREDPLKNVMSVGIRVEKVK